MFDPKNLIRLKPHLRNSHQGFPDIHVWFRAVLKLKHISSLRIFCLRQQKATVCIAEAETVAQNSNIELRCAETTQTRLFITMNMGAVVYLESFPHPAAVSIN